MHSELFARMQELRDLASLNALAQWDQETYLPKKSDDARAAQLSTLQGLAHQLLTEPRVGEWLANAAPQTDDERAMVRVFTAERERAVRVPLRLVKALAEAQSKGVSAWREARTKQDFSIFRPALETLLSLRREQADAFGHDGERYDALLEGYEPGMRVKRLTPVLSSLKAQLTPLVHAIDARPKPVDVFAGKSFSDAGQWAFTLELLRALGFDLEAGRQDRSTHPFSSGFHPLDVRVTTRVFESMPLSATFSTIHECGHGLYEQGFSLEHARTPLAQAPSMGMHESQSRLWENLVGRSRSFWEFFLPKFKAALPGQIDGVGLDAFLSNVNRVERSFIRVEADEVTYNLHIVLRYELELELLRGTLEAKDAPEAWTQKTRELLGLEVKQPSDGILQDVHWAWGDFGYFPTYALGNLYAASLFAAAKRALPNLEAGFARGAFAPLLQWLRTNVHQQGFRHSAEELVTRVTGAGLTDADFMAALRAKYA